MLSGKNREKDNYCRAMHYATIRKNSSLQQTLTPIKFDVKGKIYHQSVAHAPTNLCPFYVNV